MLQGGAVGVRAGRRAGTHMALGSYAALRESWGYVSDPQGKEEASTMCQCSRLSLLYDMASSRGWVMSASSAEE